MNEYKIMIVDDEPDILDLLEKALNIEGFQNIIKVDNRLLMPLACSLTTEYTLLQVLHSVFRAADGAAR